MCADVLRMTIWQTPAGIVDEGGIVLPSWLNFGITLLGPPANGIMHVSSLFSFSVAASAQEHSSSDLQDACNCPSTETLEH
jgi:hypothetical protein